MSSNNGKYPEWQKVIREAQAKAKAHEAEEAAESLRKANEAAKEQDKRDAYALKRVLAKLGIECEPTQGEVRLGDIVFLMSARDVLIASLPDGLKPKPEDAVISSFRLSITKAEPTDWDIDFYWPSESLNRFGTLMTQDGMWEAAQADLANLIDSLEEKCAKAIDDRKKHEEQKAKEAESYKQFTEEQNNRPASRKLEDRYMTLLREVIQEVMAEQVQF